MKGFILSLVILLGLAVVADVVARGTAERRIADRVATSLELDDKPEVEIGGWPFLVDAFAGTIPSLQIEASSVARRKVTLDRVTLRVVDVRFDVSELIRDEGRVRIAGGDGEAVMTGGAVTELLQAGGAPVTVRFEGTGVVVSSEGAPSPLPGDLFLDEGTLMVSAQGLPETYAVRLPRLGRVVAYRSVAIAEGRARLGLDLSAGVLKL